MPGKIFTTEFEPCVMVIFGATGDLSCRKLYPALYNLYLHKQLPEPFVVLGLGRRISDIDDYRKIICESVQKYSRQVNKDICGSFLDMFRFQQFDLLESGSFERLGAYLKEIEQTVRTGGNRVFFLAVSPEFFGTIVTKLAEHALIENGHGWQRVAIEKPFGQDETTARNLNITVRKVLNEENVFRIDHYLGKEMLQNLMIIRFANSLFEPLWNYKYIDNIQITVAQTGGIEKRGHYYDKAGALRDMVQNHMLQLLALTAMEPPVDLNPNSIRHEKLKVIKALRVLKGEDVFKNVVRGQYGEGIINGETVKSFIQEENVRSGSETETFVSARLFIDNLRWAGVPFYIRTGKRLPSNCAQIVVQFKTLAGVLYFKEHLDIQPNILVIKIQPEEGVYLQFNTKELGMRDRIVPVKMNYCQNCEFPHSSPEAYERVIRDVITGDSTRFMQWNEVELAWQFIDSIIDVWKNHKPFFPNYAAGTWGPQESDYLLLQDGRRWWLC